MSMLIKMYAGVSSFFIGENKVLEIAKPLSALTVEKVTSGGSITGFTIKYTAENATLGKVDGTAAELANLNLSVKLLLGEMQLNPDNEDTSVVNTAQFDAYSRFYDAASGKTGEAYHHSSTASHTAYTSDKHSISKTAYEDAACTAQITQLADGQSVWYKIVARNDGAGSGPFNIKDVMPAGMTYVSSTPEATADGKTLSWSGAMFNTLSEYKAQDYYDAFPTMRLYTPDGDYIIELFAGTVEDGNYEFVRFEFGADDAFMAYVDAFRARSTFQSDVVVEPTDRIVTLCTCSYERNNARYIVMGRLISEA